MKSYRNACSCIHDPLKMWLVEVALVCCIVCNNHCSLHITKLLHPPIAHKTFDRNPNYFPCIGKSKHFQLSSNWLVFVFSLFLYSGLTPWYVPARLAGDQLSSVVTQPTTLFGYYDLPIATHFPTKKVCFGIFWIFSISFWEVKWVYFSNYNPEGPLYQNQYFIFQNMFYDNFVLSEFHPKFMLNSVLSWLGLIKSWWEAGGGRCSLLETQSPIQFVRPIINHPDASVSTTGENILLIHFHWLRWRWNFCLLWRQFFPQS